MEVRSLPTLLLRLPGHVAVTPLTQKDKILEWEETFTVTFPLCFADEETESSLRSEEGLTQQVGSRRRN